MLHPLCTSYEWKNENCSEEYLRGRIEDMIEWELLEKNCSGETALDMAIEYNVLLVEPILEVANEYDLVETLLIRRNKKKGIPLSSVKANQKILKVVLDWADKCGIIIIQLRADQGQAIYYSVAKYDIEFVKYIFKIAEENDMLDEILDLPYLLQSALENDNSDVFELCVELIEGEEILPWALTHADRVNTNLLCNAFLKNKDMTIVSRLLELFVANDVIGKRPVMNQTILFTICDKLNRIKPNTDKYTLILEMLKNILKIADTHSMLDIMLSANMNSVTILHYIISRQYDLLVEFCEALSSVNSLQKLLTIENYRKQTPLEYALCIHRDYFSDIPQKKELIVSLLTQKQPKSAII